MPGAWPVLTPEAPLGEFMKKSTIHCSTQNMKALGHVVSPKKIFYVFQILSLWELMTPGAGPFLITGAWLAGFIKKTTTYCYIQNMKTLGLVVSEKIFHVFPMTPPAFSHDAPGAWPVWTPGALLAGFIKRTTIHCYTQNRKALCLMVLEKEDFLCFSHCKSMGANDPPGAGPFLPQGHGWQDL